MRLRSGRYAVTLPHARTAQHTVSFPYPVFFVRPSSLTPNSSLAVSVRVLPGYNLGMLYLPCLSRDGEKALARRQLREKGVRRHNCGQIEMRLDQASELNVTLDLGVFLGT